MGKKCVLSNTGDAGVTETTQTDGLLWPWLSGTLGPLPPWKCSLNVFNNLSPILCSRTQDPEAPVCALRPPIHTYNNIVAVTEAFFAKSSPLVLPAHPGEQPLSVKESEHFVEFFEP